MVSDTNRTKINKKNKTYCQPQFYTNFQSKKYQPNFFHASALLVFSHPSPNQELYFSGLFRVRRVINLFTFTCVKLIAKMRSLIVFIWAVCVACGLFTKSNHFN